MRDGTVELTPLRLDLGAGSLTAQGSVADAFDLQLAMRDVPLRLANTIRPDLGLAGTVNGTARVTGPRDAPDVRFDVTAAGVEGATTRAPAFRRSASRRGADIEPPAQPRCPRQRGRDSRLGPRARFRSAPATSTSPSTCSRFPSRSSTGSPGTADSAAP